MSTLLKARHGPVPLILNQQTSGELQIPFELSNCDGGVLLANPSSWRQSAAPRDCRGEAPHLQVPTGVYR